LRQGKLDGFGMLLKVCPISFDRQTCTPLQVFQFGSLAGKGGADIDAQFGLPVPRSSCGRPARAEWSDPPPLSERQVM
jgi:hypothetical protein